VAIASCKHTYQLFCLVQLCKEDNKWCVCKEVFHHEWWASWEIREPNEEITILFIEFDVNDVRNNLKLALKEECTTHHESCKLLNFIIIASCNCLNHIHVLCNLHCLLFRFKVFQVIVLIGGISYMILELNVDYFYKFEPHGYSFKVSVDNPYLL
jgi:hypothetical protein